MEQLICITGLAGTGKTTLVQFLQAQNIHHVCVYDFDDGPHQQEDFSHHNVWREAQATYWIKQMKKDIYEGNLPVLIGLSLYPLKMNTKVRAYIPEVHEIHWGVLICEEACRQNRLQQRGDVELLMRNTEWQQQFFAELEEIQAQQWETDQGIEAYGPKVLAWIREILPG